MALIGDGAGIEPATQGFFNPLLYQLSYPPVGRIRYSKRIRCPPVKRCGLRGPNRNGPRTADNFGPVAAGVLAVEFHGGVPRGIARPAHLPAAQSGTKGSSTQTFLPRAPARWAIAVSTRDDQIENCAIRMRRSRRSRSVPPCDRLAAHRAGTAGPRSSANCKILRREFAAAWRKADTGWSGSHHSNASFVRPN